ncbi:MAG TPA: uroporphyrinogen decarboxylase, partial [Elusimicrobiota bacterium]|nr:uroporphyrinogen decarboxylase [Elusimicrobiota bacterium]
LPEYRAIREKADFLTLCKTPELAAEVTLQPVRILGVDAAILFADILLPLRPMGVRVEFVKGEGPALSPAIRSARELARLRPVDPREGLGYVLEAIRLVRRELDGKVPLIGFAGAPFTLASYMIEGGPSRDYRHTKLMMRSQPALWRRLMSTLAGVAGEFLAAQAEAGAQALQLFDSWAGALSREDYARHVQPYSRAVLKRAAATGVPVIHFGTGTSHFLEEFRDAGGDVVGVDWRLPLGEAWRRVGRRAIQGNLDPTDLFLPRPELKRAVLRVLKEAGGKPGHIFNLGHGILPQTPVGNVRAVVDWVRRATAR